MADKRLFKGGEFIITDASPDEVFTPEDFTKDQRLIAQSVDEFYQKELVPRIEEIEDLNPELLKKIMLKAGELGFIGADISEVYGGTELDKVSSTLIAEKLSPGVSGVSVTYAVQTGIGSLPVVLFGTQEQKKKYLPKIASGEMIGAYALTEPEHGSDALSAEATAVLSEDGKYYVLNGQKQFISNAGFADLFLTYAQIDDDKFTSFIVERSWDGVSVDKEEEKMGMHGSSTRAVIFQDVKVPVENVLGEIGRGHVVALNTLNIGRYKLAAVTLGSSKLIIADSIKYAKGRIQFGKPICEFGLIKGKIADMIIDTYVLESMVYRTAGQLDLVLDAIDFTTEDSGKKTGEAIRKYALECSINKIYGSEVLNNIADEAVQILGGYGFIKDYPAEAAYRDARINRIWEGTNEINRMLIVEMLFRAALSGELPLMQAIKGITDDIFNIRPATSETEVTLGAEKDLVSMAKKIGLIAAGAAAQKFGQQLTEEQEIIAYIADIIIEIYAMESALLRTLKIIEKGGEEQSEIQIAATRVYINDAFARVDVLARQIFPAISKGEELKTQLMVLKKLSRYVPINTIKLRRRIADSGIEAVRYHLTKS